MEQVTVVVPAVYAENTSLPSSVLPGALTEGVGDTSQDTLAWGTLLRGALQDSSREVNLMTVMGVSEEGGEKPGFHTRELI